MQWISSYDAPHLMMKRKISRLPLHYLHEVNSDPALLIEKRSSDERGREHLLLALESLDERSQDILQRRWLADDKATLHELADKYGVSAERVRQLEKNAMKKLRQYIEEV